MAHNCERHGAVFRADDFLDTAPPRESEWIEEIGDVAPDEQHGLWPLNAAGALVRVSTVLVSRLLFQAVSPDAHRVV